MSGLGQSLRAARIRAGLKTSENHWVYFINAKKFAEIEGIAV